MVDIISQQPRLYDEAIAGSTENTEALARIARLKRLQESIEENPGLFKRVFTEMGESATAKVLDIHDDATTVRDASRSPKKRIEEYFSKRDDMELQLDPESDEAVFTDPDVRQAITYANSKRSILKKKGVMASTLESNPEAQAASNTTRRLIFGKMLDRYVSFEDQKTRKPEKQAG